MNPILLRIALAALALGGVAFVGFGYCLLSMGQYIRADTPKSRGLYAFPFRTNEYFTDPRGGTYRDWCLKWLAVFFASALVFAAVIAGAPNFEL